MHDKAAPKTDKQRLEGSPASRTGKHSETLLNRLVALAEALKAGEFAMPEHCKPIFEALVTADEDGLMRVLGDAEGATMAETVIDDCEREWTKQAMQRQDREDDGMAL